MKTKFEEFDKIKNSIAKSEVSLKILNIDLKQKPADLQKTPTIG